MVSSSETQQINGTAADPTGSTGNMYVVPMAGTVLGLLVAIIAIAAVSSFLALRYKAVTAWRRLPLVSWLTFAIYLNSWLFVAISTVLRYGPGIDSIWELCSTAMFLCLSFYISTKLINFFLVEKAFIVWGDGKSRLHSKLYLFNAFGMFTIFTVLGVLSFIFRISQISDGKCVVGMPKTVLIPLISLDFVINVYLTILFLIPLRKYYWCKSQLSSGSSKLHTLVRRTFTGTIITTTSCLVNLILMAVLRDEPGWICMMTCNTDILISVIAIQYVTARDNVGTQDTNAHRSAPMPIKSSGFVSHKTNLTIIGQSTIVDSISS